MSMNKRIGKVIFSIFIENITINIIFYLGGPRRRCGSAPRHAEAKSSARPMASSPPEAPIEFNLVLYLSHTLIT